MLVFVTLLTISGFTIAEGSTIKNDNNRCNSITPEILKKLKKGEVFVTDEIFRDKDGKDKGRGRAYILINRPASKVFSILLDFNKMKEYFPRIVNSKIISRKGNIVKVFFDLKFMFKHVRYYLDHFIKPDQYYFEWQLDKNKKNDIDETTGYWQICPLDSQRSIAIYSVYVDTGMLVPSFVQKWLTKGDLPDVLKTLKKRAESDGKWKKD